MPAPLLRSYGPAVLALVVLLAGCASRRDVGASSRTPPPATAVGPGQPLQAGFAPGDLADQIGRENALDRAMDDAASRSLTAAAGSQGSDPELPPAAASLLAAFEEAGLDAGAWPFHRPRTGVNVMARMVGSDQPEFVVLLSARYHPDGPLDGAVAGLTAAARGLGVLQAAGWQPRRTIMLAAWDGATDQPDGARAWIEDGPLDVAANTVALLAAVPPRHPGQAGMAASPALRTLAASVLPPTRPPDDPAGRGESGLLLAQGVPVIEVEMAAPSGGAGAEAAHGWAVLALRLADAALPPLSPAAAAQRGLMAARTLEEAARVAFDDNPPPLRELRLGLLEMRDAGEAWSRAGAAALERLERVPRGPEGAAARSRLEAAAAAARAACRLAGGPARGPGGCASLLICPGDSGSARLLPGLARAVDDRDRSAFVTQSLLLASASREAAGRLRRAADILDAAGEESP